ncbi:DNA binding domain-containing protein, excisionase family [Desulfotomaculum arcticum]|uniref:DNA binding domain-containing protein, excisionase family n=1 Tax=Desulfotruncus arcticus DSM 17038 TaxID=1121424 RepID=A0A1I2N3H5_9FIRM|nr:DNA binding domain-containing protein, excisionase family [Desulfotomaculum arcticum] [Desulfotruncus arcticus DSM 17038]
MNKNSSFLSVSGELIIDSDNPISKTEKESYFLSIKEISDILNVPRRTVYRWAVNGILPCYKFGSTYRIYYEDFKSFVDQSKNKKPSNHP